jgi:hypothetical protein
MIRVIFLAVLLTGCVSETTDLGDEVAKSGSFDLEWAIFDGVGDGAQIVSCVDAQASEVHVICHGQDGVADAVEVLPCYPGIGETGQVQAGSWDVELQLVSPAGDVIDAVSLEDVLVLGDTVTALGPIEFGM